MRQRIRLDEPNETVDNDPSSITDNPSLSDPNYPLSAKESTFCIEYMVDSNGTQAAIRSGYSANGAATTASRKLRKANIQAYLATLTNERNERVGLTVDYVVERYMRIADTEIGKVAEWTEKSVRFKRSEVIPEDTRYSICSIQETINKGGERSITLKMESKLHALDKLGAYLRMFDKTVNDLDATAFAQKLRDAVGNTTPFTEDEEEEDEED